MHSHQWTSSSKSGPPRVSRFLVSPGRVWRVNTPTRRAPLATVSSATPTFIPKPGRGAIFFRWEELFDTHHRHRQRPDTAQEHETGRSEHTS